MTGSGDGSRRCGRGLWWMVPVIAVVGLIGLCAWYRYSLSQRVQAELDRIRADGHPVTLAELNDWYTTPPPGENAADLYARAFAAYVRDEALEKRIPHLNPELDELPHGKLLPLDSIMAMGQYLKKNERARGILHDAARKKFCRFPVDFEEGLVQVHLKHLGELRQGAKLLDIESWVRVHEGNTQKAVDAIIAMLALADSIREEPHLISYEVRLSIYHLINKAIERMIDHVDLSDEQLASLVAKMQVIDFRRGLIRAAIGERCGLIAIHENPDKYLGKGDPWVEAKFLFHRMTGRNAKDLLSTLRLMDLYTARAKAGYKGRATKLREIQEFFNQVPEDHDVTLHLAPMSERSFRSDSMAVARNDACITALAIKRFAHRHKRLPEQLTDLVPRFLANVPVDPFDGRPLRWKKRESELVVYSVGEDGADDGGTKIDNYCCTEGTDITFTIRP